MFIKQLYYCKCFSFPIWSSKLRKHIENGIFLKSKEYEQFLFILPFSLSLSVSGTKFPILSFTEQPVTKCLVFGHNYSSCWTHSKRQEPLHEIFFSEVIYRCVYISSYVFIIYKPYVIMVFLHQFFYLYSLLCHSKEAWPKSKEACDYRL